MKTFIRWFTCIIMSLAIFAIGWKLMFAIGTVLAAGLLFGVIGLIALLPLEYAHDMSRREPRTR